MKKILVPIDFSEVSEHATQFAIELAEKNDAEITLLNCLHFDYHAGYEFTSFTSAKSLLADFKGVMEEKMKKFVKLFQTRRRINTMVSEMHLVMGIKDMVTEQGYDLVVIGTNGTSGLEEALVGSNTEKIVRKIPCPVISVPSRCSVDGIKKILVPIDIREIKSSFLKQIGDLQRQFDAQIEFLWVKTPHNIENEIVVSAELSEFTESFNIKDYEFTVVKNVFPSDGILLHADETNADMIAMPTHARRGISHWLSGSLTEDTVNHIDIPVWSFKMDKNEKSLSLKSIKEAYGKPEYKKIEVLTTD
ncbi:Nucleotide-binding universal stress protein, UspA family [Ekhidna lutea]|uniref:Nucleotide-binding universal stress protein, UspA family n=1 Tax=Ekhidna lutea TaxID=447679 RepID=A0A239LAU9_EKHLU|nr:universal stress protein [Ekhidna lutea]SNT27756.1 Nucleotide-binding universal stress protein, UspA family [Ekhidna lutea]